jgi:Family of unknown function (DUF6085)
MGCGEGLVLGEGGVVWCASLLCPRPSAVSELLDDVETEHIVVFGPDTFTVRHPLKERLDDALMECVLHDHIAALPGPPVPPGRYRAEPSGGGWDWAAVPDPGGRSFPGDEVA